MKVYEIAELIDKAFPPAAAEEWDNIGLLVGRRDNEVSRVLLTLDVTPYVVEEAIKSGVQMIVSHHPMMFSGVKRITDEAAEGRMLLDLCRADIAVYAAHTNLDSGVGGLNDALAALFGLNNTEVVLQGSLDGAGLGRIGDLAEPVTALEFAQMAKKLLNTSVRLSGDKNKQVKRVAVGSGASDDIIPRAAQMGADLVLTGDCKYHRNQEYTYMGVTVVDAGHYPTEIICMDIFEKVLAGYGLELIKSDMKDIFEFI